MWLASARANRRRLGGTRKSLYGNLPATPLANASALKWLPRADRIGAPSGGPSGTQKTPFPFPFPFPFIEDGFKLLGLPGPRT